MTDSSFAPDKHGFHFRNTFKNYEHVGPFTLTFRGRCGGMVYAALDYYNAAMEVPARTTPPSDGTVLGNYLHTRLATSVEHVAVKVAEVQFTNFAGLRTAEMFNWGFTTYYNIVAEYIDRNTPVPLTLHVASGSPFDLGQNHQVLAIGYDDRDASGLFTIRIYDPNAEDQVSTLRPVPQSLRFETADESGGNLRTWLTFSVNERYVPAAPPSDPDAPRQYRDLSRRNFSGRALVREDFSYTTLSHANFTGANLRNCSFINAVANNAVFVGADIKNSTWSGSATYRTNVRYANFRGADLRYNTMRNINGKGANFFGASMDEVDLSTSYLVAATFHGASLPNGRLNRSKLMSANLYGANLGRCKLRDADLRSANMQGADLGHTDLSNASLRDAICVGTDFGHANLTGADFTGADVRGADFSNAKRVGTIGLR